MECSQSSRWTIGQLLIEKPELPNLVPPGPSEQPVENEVENLELFPHLAPESLIDCALGPFEQLRIPVRAIVESDSWNPAEDVTLLGLCPSARSADKPWRSGLTLRGLEFVVVLDQLGFALRCVGKNYVEHLAVPGLQTVAMGWWG
jgi:hypothetical protein